MAIDSRHLRGIGRVWRTCPNSDPSFTRVSLLIRRLYIPPSRNEFLSPRRQLALGSFGLNMMEVQKRLYSIFRFNLYHLVSGYPRFLNPDMFRPIDEASHVGVGLAANDDIDPVLASFNIGADSHQGQSVSFILIADVRADHFQSNNPSFVVLTEVVKISGPLFAWNISRLHISPPRKNRNARAGEKNRRRAAPSPPQRKARSCRCPLR